MDVIYNWLPDLESAYADLRHIPKLGTDDPDDPAFRLLVWRGMPLGWYVPGDAEGGVGFFSATYWTKRTAEHWEVPLVAVFMYIIAIPLLKHVVSRYGKFNVRNIAFWWNTTLSIFSWCGALACVPVLVTSLKDNGLYFTICAPPFWYGSGVHGMFIMLFIYSKVAELLDTVLLLLAGKPVITLQWWHHSTVLLFCWHAYAVRIATGAWFACMNYVVHSLMYAYFALTATKYRKMVSGYAIYITFLQIMQMIVGMGVIMKAVGYQLAGEECHVNKTNSILGLAMYASYFVLFFKFFMDSYCSKNGAKRNGAKENGSNGSHGSNGSNHNGVNKHKDE